VLLSPRARRLRADPRTALRCRPLCLRAEEQQEQQELEELELEEEEQELELEQEREREREEDKKVSAARGAVPRAPKVEAWTTGPSLASWWAVCSS